MSCALHEIGFLVAERVSDALSSTAFNKIILSFRENDQADIISLLEKVLDTKKIIAALPDKVEVSPSHEQALRDVARSLPRTLESPEDIITIHQQATGFIEIIWKITHHFP